MNANTIANYVCFIFKIQPKLTTSQLCHWHPGSSQLHPWPGLILRPAFCFPCDWPSSLFCPLDTDYEISMCCPLVFTLGIVFL